MSSPSSTATTRHTVPLWSLVGIIIGSTIGAGMFSLPQNIGSVAGPGAMFIGWSIAGVGMLCVAFVLQILATRKPHLDSGVYSYVRAGLGDYIGFISGWGYWLGSVIAQVGYATLFFSTLGHYVPWFDSNHRLQQAIAVSVLTWVIFAILTRGVKQAAIMNAVTTIAKLVPILAFIVLVAFLGFAWDTFTLDFWGHSTGTSVSKQVQGIMLFTVWVFIGVEGASVYSKQAQTRKDVGRATVIGFFAILFLLVSITTLSYGVMTQQELAALPDNSMASVLEAVIGPVGGMIVSAGLCLSVLGAYVSWQMLCAEPMVMMANDGLLPTWLGKTNSHGAPVNAQLVSTITIQLWIIVFFFNETTYNSMVQLATILYLIPYLFSALYLLMLATRGKGLAHPHAGIRFDDSGPEVSPQSNRRHLVISLVAFIYSLWLIYAADPKYVLLGAIVVIPGLIPFAWTKLHKKERVFNRFEAVVAIIIAIAALYALWGLATGRITL